MANIERRGVALDTAVDRSFKTLFHGAGLGLIALEGIDKLAGQPESTSFSPLKMLTAVAVGTATYHLANTRLGHRRNQPR